MYQPSAFRETRDEALQDFMRVYPFATLIVHGEGGLSADHLPLLWEDGVLRGHIATANALALMDGAEVLVIFHGPQGYVSPNWYPSKHLTGREVPTWNYTVVHAHGKLKVLDDPVWTRDLLQRLTQLHEADEPNPWSLADAPNDYIDGLLNAIRGVEISVCRIEGKFKLGQNKSDANRRGVIDGLQRRARKDDHALRVMTEQTLTSTHCVSTGPVTHEQ